MSGTRMAVRKGLVLVAVSLMVGTGAQGATRTDVTATLSISYLATGGTGGNVDGTWEVRCSLTGDMMGLRGFQMNVTADKGSAASAGTITGSWETAPSDIDQVMWGFVDYTDNGPLGLAAGQKTIYGTTYKTTSDNRVLRNVGQLAGSRLDQSYGLTITWDADVLLACGAFTDAPVGSKLVATPVMFHVLRNFAGVWRGPGNVDGIDLSCINTPEVTIVPEPTTLALLFGGLGGLAMTHRRRR